MVTCGAFMYTWWFILIRLGPRPLLVYYSTAYGLGLAATAVYKILVG